MHESQKGGRSRVSIWRAFGLDHMDNHLDRMDKASIERDRWWNIYLFILLSTLSAEVDLVLIGLYSPGL